MSVAGPEARKAAIRAVLGKLGELAESAGLRSTARDIRQERLPKLDEERFTVVVLGEFNHGKSTFINALLAWQPATGAPAAPPPRLENAILPVGITPTTAVLAHLRHGDRAAAEVVRESGARTTIEVSALPDWISVDEKAAADADPVAHVDIRVPAAFLQGGVTVVDTPGVNDINQQRADITYGYIPRADAVLFLLDAGQVLTASERRFLEERILRSSRDRLVFVVSKADLLDPAELEEALAFARRHLEAIVPEAPLYAVSAKRALQGDLAGSALPPLLEHLRVSLGAERRQLIHDHALADAGRVATFLRQSLSMRRRSLELPVADLELRVTRAQEKLRVGRRALDQAAETIRAETAALKARVRQDLTAFTEELAVALPGQIDKVSAPDVQRYLGPFVEDTWKRWVEAEADRLAGELERVAERVIQVANENAEEVTRNVSAELGRGGVDLDIAIDTFKYDASVFALGALGTTVFLFVNTLAGGLLALAAPIAAFFLKGRVAHEIKQEARQRAPEAVRGIAAALAPKLDEIVEGFSARLSEFVAEAGAALQRGIAEVLAAALAERKQRVSEAEGLAEGRAVDELLARLKTVEEEIALVRQKVWEGGATL